MIGLIFCYLIKKQEYHTNISTLTQIGKSAHFTLFGFNFLCPRKVAVFWVSFHLWILPLLPTVQFFCAFSEKYSTTSSQYGSSITRNGSTIAFSYADFASDSHFGKKWETSCASFFLPQISVSERQLERLLRLFRFITKMTCLTSLIKMNLARQGVPRCLIIRTYWGQGFILVGHQLQYFTVEETLFRDPLLNFEYQE